MYKSELPIWAAQTVQFTTEYEEDGRPICWIDYKHPEADQEAMMVLRRFDVDRIIRELQLCSEQMYRWEQQGQDNA